MFLFSVQFSCSVVFDSLWPQGLQHTRLPCPSSAPRAYSNSCPSNQWCHPTISSSVVLFSSCLQSFLASGAFPMSQFFTSGSQSIGVLVLGGFLSLEKDLFYLTSCLCLFNVAVWASEAICCCSVAQSCLTLFDPKNCSTPGTQEGKRAAI